jgi:tetratricopeptide (TPR) repeat protein
MATSKPNRNDIFKRHFTTAINAIAALENKTTAAVEEDLGELIGVSGRTVQGYKAGKLPPPDPDNRVIRVLATAGVRRGLMGREWLERFLHAARYPTPDKLIDELYPTQAPRPRPERVYENLPAPSYDQFVMRPQAFVEVVDGLEQRSASVLIVGMGGNGKTSLAREVAAQCLQDNNNDIPSFDAVVWVSDKDNPGMTNQSTALDTIARTLGYPGLTQFPHDEKQYEVEQLLRNQKVLLIIDNGETITDGALFTWLLRLPEPSKAIITTRERHRVLWSSWLVELRGMSEDEARALLQQRLERLRIAHLVHDQTQLEPLLAATGGNPKAITMAAGLLKYERRPLQQIVDDLYAARGDLFDDLFHRVWTLLDEQGKHILMVMTFFPDSASTEALQASVDLTAFDFDRTIERLTDLSLLDVQQEDLMSEPRYSVHPLVQAFASSRLENHPALEAALRQRWSQYFLDLVSRSLRTGRFRERYWDCLSDTRCSREGVVIEIATILNVLKWAEQENQTTVLIDMMLLVTHLFSYRSFYLERITYARKAADAAHTLERYADEALLRIDALGWVLIETERLQEAERELRTGLELAEHCIDDAATARDLCALACAFLARVYLEHDDIEQSLAWIHKALPIACQPVIQRRVLEVAGTVAHKQGRYQAAIEACKQARHIARSYNAEGDIADEVYHELGFAYLGRGDIKQNDIQHAEREFESLRALGHRASSVEHVQATYGLAQVAHAKGDIDTARQLAEEARDWLVRLRVRHRMLREITTFLEQLGAFDTPEQPEENAT